MSRVKVTGGEERTYKILRKLIDFIHTLEGVKIARFDVEERKNKKGYYDHLWISMIIGRPDLDQKEREERERAKGVDLEKVIEELESRSSTDGESGKEEV